MFKNCFLQEVVPICIRLQECIWRCVLEEEDDERDVNQPDCGAGMGTISKC